MELSDFTVSEFSCDWAVDLDGVPGGNASADGRNKANERSSATTNNIDFFSMGMPPVCIFLYQHLILREWDINSEPVANVVH
jgi:hypothetical protein